MARIRSVRPELRTSNLVASWPIDMRYFFVLLWGYLDDRGRGLDVPKQIAGDCFPHDEKISPGKVDRWLQRMTVNLTGDQGPICRYEVNGTRYLHAVNWGEHQRPNRPTPSRIPRCPTHGGDGDGLTEPLSESLTEPDPPDRPRNEVTERSQRGKSPRGHTRSGTTQARSGNPEPGDAERYPQVEPARLSESLSEGLNASSPDGEGEKGRRGEVNGSLRSPYTHTSKVRTEPDAEREPGSAGPAESLIHGWRSGCRRPPPSAVINQVGRRVVAMLRDGIAPTDIAEGLRLWQSKGLDPGRLPAVVNQVMNADPPPDKTSNVVALRPDNRPSTTDQRVGDALALAAELRAEREASGT